MPDAPKVVQVLGRRPCQVEGRGVGSQRPERQPSRHEQKQHGQGKARALSTEKSAPVLLIPAETQAMRCPRFTVLYSRFGRRGALCLGGVFGQASPKLRASQTRLTHHSKSNPSARLWWWKGSVCSHALASHQHSTPAPDGKRCWLDGLRCHSSLHGPDWFRVLIAPCEEMGNDRNPSAGGERAWQGESEKRSK